MNLHYKESRLLRISSEDRASTSRSATDIIYNTNDNDLSQIRKIILKTAIIPNTQYNVNQYNNTWLFPNITNPGGNYIVPVGQYDIATLITTLQGLVAGLTITQDAITGKLTLSMATNFDIVVTNNTFGVKVLGVSSTSLATTSYTCGNLPDLSGLKVIYIASNTLGNHGSLSASRFGKDNIICDVGVTVPYGFNIYNEEGEDSLDYVVFHSPKNITSFDIKLTDSDGNVLDLNGIPWELIFRVYSEVK